MSDKWKTSLRQVYRILYLTIRFFTTKRVMTQASALTYSTLLAIVPILAVVFAIARGFGFNKYIEVWFRDALSSQPQAAEVIVGFVNSYLVHTKSGIFLGVGLIFMLYTVLMLVNNVEETFNQIWQVSNSRPIIRSFTNYLAMFFLFPIIIIVTTGLSIFMATIADSMGDSLLIGPAVHKLLDVSPYLLLSLLFIGLYVYMPNTKVRISSAVIPGILAGVAMQLLQTVYIHSQIWVTGYNAIYGSFAALPLFMLWVQISWTICLFGAQLTYTNQNLNRFGINLEFFNMHPKIDMSDEDRADTVLSADTIDSL
ncbi:MAG: YihY/virulence factor BrkB family protein [Prevotella sp.]|nr:YihY/virulence factor BrkB family protein [Prevotella sp.]